MKILTTVHPYLEAFISLFYPNTCISCGHTVTSVQPSLCIRCIGRLPTTEFHRVHPNVLHRKFYGRLPIAYALAYMKYTRGSALKNILREIKYGNKPELATLFGQWYGALLKEEGYAQAFDVMIPIPLHKNRLSERGYNQSEVFARPIAEALGAEVETVRISRRVETSTQTRKGRWMRWKNVENIYGIEDGSYFNDKNLVIVDDVITTGATIESLGQLLLPYQPRSISVLALAMADY